MIGESGCFGGSQPAANETIDNMAEVSAAVDDIISDTGTVSSSASAAVVLARHYAYMERRVRMLTWAVVALAAVALLSER